MSYDGSHEMNKPTYLGKIVEFLHRTKYAERITTDNPTDRIITAIVSLAYEHDWNVDRAVDWHNEMLEDFGHGLSSPHQQFDAQKLIDSMVYNLDIQKNENKQELERMLGFEDVLDFTISNMPEP